MDLLRDERSALGTEGWERAGVNIVFPCRLSFFKIWPFSAEFHITHMYSIYKYLAKMMLLRENLPFMAEFFNPHQKLCQGTND